MISNLWKKAPVRTSLSLAALLALGAWAISAAHEGWVDAKLTAAVEKLNRSTPFAFDESIQVTSVEKGPHHMIVFKATTPKVGLSRDLLADVQRYYRQAPELSGLQGSGVTVAFDATVKDGGSMGVAFPTSSLPE